MSARGGLVVVAAPSGAGKTSLTRALIERLKKRGIPAAFSVSYTTRDPRPGEQDGVDYHFLNKFQLFAEMQGRNEFLEHAKVFGNYYGTGVPATEAALNKGAVVFLDIDWQGAQQVRERFPDSISIFIKPPSLDELEKRLRARGQDDEATIRRRMQEAETELSHAHEFKHVLVNADFNRTLDAMEAVVMEAIAAPPGI